MRTQDNTPELLKWVDGFGQIDSSFIGQVNALGAGDGIVRCCPAAIRWRNSKQG